MHDIYVALFLTNDNFNNIVDYNNYKSFFSQFYTCNLPEFC